MGNLPPFDAWRPLTPDAVAGVVSPFDNWWLCGGLSVDWLAGHQTRAHGDTDIGVFAQKRERVSLP